MNNQKLTGKDTRERMGELQNIVQRAGEIFYGINGVWK